ncbi:MAG: hypothetical protein COB35_06660 [Gammaproteobacteria bacterium]|nr:MAG: hypothetical protein COB35_06660 [Gammaproteobacteria bacterium]
MALLLTFSVHAEQAVIINDVSWPPYFFVGDKNPQQGIGKELLNICVPLAGYKIEYRRLPIKRTYLYMENGDIDITAYSYRKEREQFLIYAKEKLFSSDLGFVVKAGSNIVIKSLKDLTPYKIGRLAGLSYSPEFMAIIEDKEKKHQVITSYNSKSMFSQLLASTPRFDIMANSKSTFYWQAKMLGVSGKIKVLDFSIKNKNYFITVSKKSINIKDPQAFIAKIDNCLRTLKSNGKYNEILASYGYTIQ